MGKTLPEIPKSVYGRPRGAGAKYPWDKWLDGQVWLLNRSDIDDDVSGISRRVYTAAKVRGIKVKVSRNAARGEVYVKAIIAQ